MARTASKETRAKKAIRLIRRNGYSWEQVAEELGVSVGYAQQLARNCYKTPANYNNLLAVARKNKKDMSAKSNDETTNPVASEDETQVSPQEPEVPKQTEEVDERKNGEFKNAVVVESGYLIRKGIRGIINESVELFVPMFCIWELEKLSDHDGNAKSVLTYFYGKDGAMIPINLKRKEKLLVNPSTKVRDRSIGVVAVCCHLWWEGYNICLKTNSQEIVELAKSQGIGIQIEMV